MVGTATRDCIALAMWASNSGRKRSMADAMGDTADGPSGQMVVCFGGQAMPGLMLSLTSISSARSLGRP